VHIGDLLALVLEEFDDLLRILGVDRSVEGLLSREQMAVAQVFHLVRKVREDLLLDPAQGEDPEPLPQHVELVVGGVPVRAIRKSAGTFLAARAALVRGFLMRWASSKTVTAHVCSRRSSMDRKRMSYVVSTTPPRSRPARDRVGP
jgi:hypothetical protein